MISVVVVDDEQLVRSGFEALLASDPDITVVGSEILVAVARGLSNAEIGAALHMSASTAKTDVGRLLSKLEARDRTHLVIAAYDAGLVGG